MWDFRGKIAKIDQNFQNNNYQIKNIEDLGARAINLTGIFANINYWIPLSCYFEI
jgi:hypothetical protein